MDEVLWWAIGIILGIIALAVVLPGIYDRTIRKRDKHLGRRRKRKIKL